MEGGRTFQARAASEDSSPSPQDIIPLIDEVSTDLDAELERLCALSEAERNLADTETYTAEDVDSFIRRCRKTERFDRLERTLYHMEARGLVDADLFVDDASEQINTTRKQIHESRLALEYAADTYAALATPSAAPLAPPVDPDTGCMVSRAICWLNRATSTFSVDKLVIEVGEEADFRPPQ